MKGKICEDYERFFDHDVYECPVCQPKDDHFLDSPCDECGHTWDEMAVGYYESDGGINYKTFFVLCDRCNLARVRYSGRTQFSAKETGPGDDLSSYRFVER